MLGSAINTNKCYKMVVKPARVRIREREGLPGVTLARSIRYLGVDLLSTYVAPRVVADRRAADFVDRCRFCESDSSLTAWRPIGYPQVPVSLSAVQVRVSRLLPLLFWAPQILELG